MRRRLRANRGQLQIHARISISADGYVTTPDGWPAQLADPSFVSGQSHGTSTPALEPEPELIIIDVNIGV